MSAAEYSWLDLFTILFVGEIGSVGGRSGEVKIQIEMWLKWFSPGFDLAHPVVAR